MNKCFILPAAKQNFYFIDWTRFTLTCAFASYFIFLRCVFWQKQNLINFEYYIQS